jgi:hypothetical protein
MSNQINSFIFKRLFMSTTKIKTVISLAIVFVFGFQLSAQNLTVATNGLYEPTNSSVGLGGTLNTATTIDLSTYTFKLYKTGAGDYFNLLNNGNIGIGVTTPLYKLDLAGAMRIGSLSADPTGAAGVLYYNSTLNKLKAYVNGGWKNVLMEEDLSAGYIQNQTASAQIAGFNISGTSTIGGDLNVGQGIYLINNNRIMASYGNMKNGIRVSHTDNWPEITFDLNMNNITTGYAGGGKSVSLINVYNDIFFQHSGGSGRFIVQDYSGDGLQLGTMGQPILFNFGGTDIARFAQTTQNFLINKATDNTTDKLQVGGNVWVQDDLKLPKLATTTPKMLVVGADGLVSSQGIGSTIPVTTASYIYVDKNNPYATDNRAGISNYSFAQPFYSIQAAYNASTSGDIIYVRPGTHNENLSITSFTNTGRNFTNAFIFDNAILDGGAGSAMVFNENFDASITLNNSSIRNTGSASDKEGTAAIRTITARVRIFGNSNLSCGISSVEAHAFNDFSNALNYYTGVTFSSTNGAGYYSQYNGNGYFTHCSIVSVNSYAMRGYSYYIDRSYIRGNSYGVLLGDNIRLTFTINESHIEATGGVAIGGGALGGWDYGDGRISNSNLVSYNEAMNFNTGNWSIGYHLFLENNRIRIGNPSVTSALILPGTGSTELLVKAINITSSKSLFATDFRNGYAAYINETNTLVENTSFYVGVKAGFGEPNPAANIHVKGTAILDIPTSTLNANDLLYSKDIATGQMKLVAAPSGNGGGGGVALPSMQVAYGSGTGVISNANLTFDGTNLLVAGNIGIGTNDTKGYCFAVNGNAVFTRVKVKEYTSWPDYVFDHTYKLPTLKEVAAFIKAHKHLPEVPSAEEVKKDGLDIGGNQALLLKKIEELTLYAIEQNKKQEEQTKRIEQLEKELTALKRKM